MVDAVPELDVVWGVAVFDAIDEVKSEVEFASVTVGAVKLLTDGVAVADPVVFEAR